MLIPQPHHLRNCYQNADASKDTGLAADRLATLVCLGLLERGMG